MLVLLERDIVIVIKVVEALNSTFVRISREALFKVCADKAGEASEEDVHVLNYHFVRLFLICGLLTLLRLVKKTNGIYIFVVKAFYTMVKQYAFFDPKPLPLIVRTPFSYL